MQVCGPRVGALGNHRSLGNHRYTIAERPPSFSLPHFSSDPRDSVLHHLFLSGGGCAPTKNGRNVHARSHGGCATERPLTRPAGRALGGDPIAPKSLSSRFQSHGGNRAIAEGEEGDVASSHAPGGIWGARVHDGNQFGEEDRGHRRWCEAWASHWDTARPYQLAGAGKMEGGRPAAAGLPRRAGRPAHAARARGGSGFWCASVARMPTG